MQTVERQRATKAKGVSVTEFSEFRLFLQNELVQRCRANPKYSLRAFAKFLKIDHSSLSQYLRGQRKLSQAVQLKLAMKLGLSPVQIAHFWSAQEASVSSGSSAQAVIPSREAYELSLDAFQVVADWYHYAIFELVTVKEFRQDARWIAKTLGITVSEVHAATERLMRLGLITVEDGVWKQGAPLITTVGNPFTAAAFRKLQAQVLEMAITAMEEIPMELRDQGSMTMAIHTRRLPEAKERIKKFRRELCDFLQQDRDSDRDAVYQLNTSFYPLTRPGGGKDQGSQSK
jgi:uncharacterized protein (TIGR02147 family)